MIDGDGKVLAATRSLVGLPVVYAVPAGSTDPVRQKAADNVIPGEVRVVAVTTTVHGRQVTIVAGTPTNLLREINSEFARHLLIGLPAVLLLAGAAVWLIVGRALRPVEQIRRTVEEITSADLAQRVPEPGTADEVGHLAETMNGMLSRLENAAHRQRRFVADASHELRTPLAAIRTTLEVGLAHPDRAPWPEIADRAVRQSARMEELIRQLLLLAKADEGQLAARQRHVDVRALLDTIQSSNGVKEVAVVVEAGPHGAVMGDRDQLDRLFGNLVDNAVRYACRQVVLTLSTDDRNVRVTVDDDGPGIPTDDRQRVFDRFVRLDPSRERGSGTAGLGLAIAREIVAAHGGDIHVSDSPAGGARVVVELPRAGKRATDPRG